MASSAGAGARSDHPEQAENPLPEDIKHPEPNRQQNHYGDNHDRRAIDFVAGWPGDLRHLGLDRNEKIREWRVIDQPIAAPSAERGQSDWDPQSNRCLVIAKHDIAELVAPNEDQDPDGEHR